MTKEQVKKHIIKCAKKTFSKSFQDIKKDIYNSYKKNDFGCSDYLTDKKNGYYLFFTDNQNFCNGKKNGFGAGYYARLKYCGYVEHIKISN